LKRIIPKIGLIRDEAGNLVRGVLIRDPETRQRLPAEGIVVDRVNAYWRRRAAEGGVTIVDALPISPPTIGSVTPSQQPARARSAKEE